MSQNGFRTTGTTYIINLFFSFFLLYLAPNNGALLSIIYLLLINCIIRFGSTSVEHCSDIGRVLASLSHVQSMIDRIGVKEPSTEPTRDIPPAEPAIPLAKPLPNYLVSSDTVEPTKLTHSGTEPELPVVETVVESWLDDVARAELLGLAEEVNQYKAEAEYELKEVDKVTDAQTSL